MRVVLDSNVLLSVVKMPDAAQPIPARSETLRAFAGTDARRRVREFPGSPPAPLGPSSPTLPALTPAPLPRGEGRQLFPFSLRDKGQG